MLRSTPFMPKPIASRAPRGLTLLECMMAVLIIAITLLAISEIDVNTIRTATKAGNMRLGALLANELLARACLGEFPEEVGVETGEGRQSVDTEEFGIEYSHFEYEITKTIEELDIESRLGSPEVDEWGDPIEDEEPLPGSEEEARREQLPKIQVIRVRVTVYYPVLEQVEEDFNDALDENAPRERPGQVTLETFIRDPFAQDSLNPESDTTGDGTGTPGT